jgi:hypothetical protein
MSRQVDDNSYSSANAIAVAGLNLALSYENAAVDRLEKRLSESIVPEVKQKIIHHLDQTKNQTRIHYGKDINNIFLFQI